jgi:hypothetical protein
MLIADSNQGKVGWLSTDGLYLYEPRTSNPIVEYGFNGVELRPSKASLRVDAPTAQISLSREGISFRREDGAFRAWP